MEIDPSLLDNYEHMHEADEPATGPCFSLQKKAISTSPHLSYQHMHEADESALDICFSPKKAESTSSPLSFYQVYFYPLARFLDPQLTAFGALTCHRIQQFLKNSHKIFRQHKILRLIYEQTRKSKLRN